VSRGRGRGRGKSRGKSRGKGGGRLGMSANCTRPFSYYSSDAQMDVAPNAIIKVQNARPCACDTHKLHTVPV